MFDLIIHFIAIYAIPILFAISLHEAAHGYVARYFGDPTAEKAGRLTLNPFAHIHPVGTVLLPLLLVLLKFVPLGFAKPVPVDFSRLRNPRKHMAFVAFAGPLANFVMGLSWTIIGLFDTAAGLHGPLFGAMVQAGVLVNAAMFVFNLIPIPPLDGGRITVSLLPLPLAVKFAQIERYNFYIFMGLIVMMQLHILDGFLISSMLIVRSVFNVLVSPLNILLN